MVTMEWVKTFNIRTGWHSYWPVEMPDGQIRAVWEVYDGPSFDGYYTSKPGHKAERTTKADYEEYRRRRYSK